MMSEMSECESDIDAIPPPKKVLKPRVLLPDDAKHEKKITTKVMIIDALTELHTRKGVSLYAIKKYLTEKYQVNTDRSKFTIKKTLKTCVEDGTFVQLKGIGASGSFKLATNKVKKPKKKKDPESGKEVQKKEVEKTKKKLPEKKAIPKTKQKNTQSEPEIKSSKKVKDGEIKVTKKMKEKEKSVEEKKKKPKVVMVEPEKKTKVKSTKPKEKKTPTEKRASMMKRKSIGSIIKAPKMKPKK